MLLSSPNNNKCSAASADCGGSAATAAGSVTGLGLLRVHIPTAPSAYSSSLSSSLCSAPHSSCSTGLAAAAAGAPSMMTPGSGVSGHLPMSPRVKEEWFSLEGPMYMKCLSGALSLIQPRKRLYFGLEELENKLIFYRTKADFDARKDCLGHIPMAGAVCSLMEANMKAFLLHTEAGKKYMFEADNEKAVDHWLNALQQRRDGDGAGQCVDENGGGGKGEEALLSQNRRHRSRSKSVGHSDSDSELMVKAAAVQRQRARSHYNQQQQQPHSSRQQHLPSLRLPSALISNGFSPTLESIASSSNSPGTPLSEAGGLSRRKYSRIAQRKQSPSSSAVTTKLGSSETPPKLSIDGPGECCCVCGGAGDQWMLNSWLWEQQRHNAELMKQQQQPSDCRSLTIFERRAQAAVRNGSGEVNETPSEGRADEADLDSPGSPPPLPHHHLPMNSLNSLPAAASTAECGQSSSSETCESAGALVADQHRGREDELLMLRKLSNRQKEHILELRTELERARRRPSTTTMATAESQPVGDDQPSSAAAAAASAAFVAKSRFLNAELLRINERKQEADKLVETYKRRIGQLEAEMEEFKKEYVHLLQSCVRIPLRENSACDVVQVKLYGGDEHERRVKKLLERAREADPTLPTLEGVTGRDSFHVDEYGFRHNFAGDVPLALHFIATQLHEHYQTQSADHVQLKARWRTLLDQQQQPERIDRNRETRQLCRLGIPRSLRSRVWRLLIADQVADLKAKNGPYYYRNLCNSQGTPTEKHYSAAHQKQVNLDLLRTMPGNVHFMSASCKGVTHLQSVLRAFCLHNPSIGYCQGMNFLVATALLFMGPEDAFWFLVAITERYFDASYFDQSLSGAQADQEVLKEIVEQKFPRLAQHLDECEIDLTTVTLNWFIALFFDAVPFQTMLRIWDCFLMEGPKVLFRFTVALLGLYEEDILAHSDTISVIKVLKAGVRLALDIDGMIKYAFEDLNPFPTKAYLRQRQSLYLQVIQERLQKRQQLRQFLNVSSSVSNSQSDQLADLPIEVVVFSPFVQGRGYVCAGNQKRGKISLIQLHEEAVNLNTMDLEFDCRPVSMVIFQPEMAFVSLLSGYITAIHLNPSGQAEILWELKLNDVALKLVHCSRRLYSCLANGTLAVLENAFERMPTALDLYHIPVAAAPITDALLDEEHLYLAVACKIVVLNKQTLSTVASVYVASAAAGSQVPMFEKIRAMANSPHGIWLITAHSSLLQLWRDGQCQMLFDIRYDHSHRKPSFDEQDDQLEQVEVCAIHFHDEELWVGTVDGYLMLYRIHLATDSTGYSATTNNKARPVVGKYQPGKRLSAAHGLAQPVPANRLQTYYIPTETEARNEEQHSSMECMQMEGPERAGAGRKISVKIDQNTRKYSVNVLTIRRPSCDSATTNYSGRIGGSSRLTSSSTTFSEQQQQTTNNRPFHQTGKRPLSTQQSIDSALSSLVDSSGPSSSRDAKQAGDSPTPESMDPDEFGSGQEEEGEEDEVEEEEAEEGAGSGGRSELEEQQRRRFPSRLVRINSWRRLSCSVDTDQSSRPIPVPSNEFAGRKFSFSSSATASAMERDAAANGRSEEVRIRRKDLDFEEPLLLAVKEGEELPPSLGASPPTRRPSMCKLMENSQLTTATNGSRAELVETTEIKSSFGMALQMKLKVADKPLRCIAVGQFGGQSVMVTGSGEYGDEEALLRWRRDTNSGLWINDPLVDISVRFRKRTAGISSPTKK